MSCRPAWSRWSRCRRKVEAEFDRLFSRDLPAEAEGEVEIDAEAETPEPLVGGRLDLGEILAEELSLALDPYPRAPEADRHLAEFGGRGRRRRALALRGAWPRLRAPLIGSHR